MKEWVRSFDVGVEECILLAIIILNFFDGFEILPGDLDYVKKLISWSALAVMFVHARLDKVLAGVQEKKAAHLIIAGFFLLTIKNLVGYAQSVYPVASPFLKPFFTELLLHAGIIELIGIGLGIVLIAAGALRLALKGVDRPSLVYAFTNKTTTKVLPSFILIFLFSLLFFVGIFNITMEWLAIAIDAPLLMIGLAVFALHLMQSHKLKKHIPFLSRFGNFGIAWYEKIISKLEYRKHLVQIAACIVALHGFTDALIFLWPSIFGFGDLLYFGTIGTAFISFWTYMLAGNSIIEIALLGIAYVANLLSIGVVLIGPLVLWFEYFEKKVVMYSPKFLGVLFGSFVIATLIPAFDFSLLTSDGVYGVHFALIPLQGTPFLMEFILLGSALGLSAGLLAQKHAVERLFQGSVLAISIAAYCIYIIAYTWAISTFYLTIVPLLWPSIPLVALLFSVFFLATVLIIGFGSVGLMHVAKYHMQEHHQHHKKTIR